MHAQRECTHREGRCLIREGMDRLLTVLHFVWFPHARRKQKAKQDSYFSYADWFFMISISWFARFASIQRHLTMINISARCSDNEINIFCPEMKVSLPAAAGRRAITGCSGPRQRNLLSWGSKINWNSLRFSVMVGSLVRRKNPLKPHFLLRLFFGN